MKTNENILKKLEIIRQLSYVPEERLKEVESYIKFILIQSDIKFPVKEKEPKTLAGIWKDKGFEKIADVDREIKKLRAKIGNRILDRQI